MCEVHSVKVVDKRGHGKEISCLPPHAHSEGELSWVEEEGTGVPFILIKSLSFAFSLLLSFLLLFFLSLPFFYCPPLYMCGLIVFYCRVINLHTLDDRQQLPSTLFRAVQIGSWDSLLLDSLLSVSKVQNQNVIPATFCFGTGGPLPSTCVYGRIQLVVDFFKHYPIKSQ